MTVVGEASTGEQALQLAGTLMPEVVIMDMHMPGWNGAESTRRILKEHPSTVVIGLSIQTDPHIAESMLDAGAAAFLPKETIGKELYSAIQTAVHRMTSSRICHIAPLRLRDAMSSSVKGHGVRLFYAESACP